MSNYFEQSETLNQIVVQSITIRPFLARSQHHTPCAVCSVPGADMADIMMY